MYHRNTVKLLENMGLGTLPSYCSISRRPCVPAISYCRKPPEKTGLIAS